MENLRISIVDKFQDLIAAVTPRAADNDDDETDIGRKVRAAKSQLAQLKLESRESRNHNWTEYKKIRDELWEKQRQYNRLAKKAQKHISLYEYAVLMRSVRPVHATNSTEKTATTERLIGKRGSEAQATASSETSGPINVTTLILRSQTFYASSAFMWQLMVQTILQVRLLRKAHLLTMHHQQEAIFKAHKSEEVKAIAQYIRSSDKLDELCIGLMQRKSEVMLQIEATQLNTNELKETYADVVQKQRKLILKLRLRENQAVSDQVKEKIQRRSELLQDIDNSPIPFLVEMKRESLKRLSTISERASLHARASQVNGALVEKIRMEFSLDEAFIQQEEAAEAQRRVDMGGRDSPNSAGVASPDSGGMTSTFTKVEENQHTDKLCESFSTMGTLSDDEMDVEPQATEPTKKGKRSRAELRASLDRIALNRSKRNADQDNSSVVSSASRRSELAHRRLQAEQRLAKSKRNVQRDTMRAKRQMAKQRLEESKRKLQGFLAASDDEDDDSYAALPTKMESSTSLQDFSNLSIRSPDSVSGFPYVNVSANSLPNNDD